MNEYHKQSMKQRFNYLVSRAVRGANIFNPLLVARREMCVNAAKKEMEGKTFCFDGIALPYSYFSYNSTYGSERAIEISIGKYFLDTRDDVLEVGNVMSHYLPASHFVIDKYEKSSYINLINADICDVQCRKFKNILSISTLEHVGFDEPEKDPTKFYSALERIKGLLIEGGEALITVPWGYNPCVDDYIKNSSCLLYSREGREWKSSSLEQIKDKTFGAKYSCANAIAVIRL
jgi:hypothetical protein